MPAVLNTLSSEIICENPWWRYKHDTYRLPNGEIGDYYYGERYGTVIIVPLRNDGKLALVRQYRYLARRFSVELPMGGIEEDETPRAAARRELLEETGYEADAMMKVATFEPTNGIFKNMAHVFVAMDLTLAAIDKATVDASEDFEVFYRRPDEFEDMIRRGEIWDGETLAAWSLAKHNLHYEAASV